MKALIKFVLLTAYCSAMTIMTAGGIHAMGTSAEAVEDNIASDATLGAADSGRQFLTYVYAVERAERMAQYQQLVLEKSLDATVLFQFGLASEETAVQLSAQYQMAEQEATALAAAAETAYDEFMRGFAFSDATVAQSVYGQSTPASGRMTDGSAAAHEAASETSAPAGTAHAWAAMAGEEASAMLQALLVQEDACREAVASDVKLQAGMVDGITNLSSHEACLQAALIAINEKEIYITSLLDAWQAETGSPISLHALLSSMQDLEQEGLNLPKGSLSAEWIDALAACARLSITSSSEHAALSAGLEGEVMPHTSVAMPGARFSLLSPPIHLASGGLYVPLKPYAQALQFQVSWHKDNNSISLVRGRDRIELQPASRHAVANGQEIELEAAPIIWLQQTYVPLSFFDQAAGAKVYWHEQQKQGAILPE